MDKPLIEREVAEAEVTAWLDHKKMSASRREEKKEAIESLIKFVSNGTVVIDKETFKLTQKLIFPVGKDEQIKELVWEPFGQVGKFMIHMKNVDSADFTGNAIARACAQTGKAKAILCNLDSEDEIVLKIISVFFM